LETNSTTVVDGLVKMDDELINSNKGCNSSRRTYQLTVNTDGIAAAGRSAAIRRNK